MPKTTTPMRSVFLREMKSLITLGTIAAFGYSLFVTVAPHLLPVEVRAVYYEAVGVILGAFDAEVEAASKAEAGRRNGDPRPVRGASSSPARVGQLQLVVYPGDWPWPG